MMQLNDADNDNDIDSAGCSVACCWLIVALEQMDQLQQRDVMSRLPEGVINFLLTG